MSKRQQKQYQPLMPDSQYNFLAQSKQSLAYDIVDELFEKQHGTDSLLTSQETISSSTCSVDQRLLYWKRMLQERRAMQNKLRLATGKEPEELLFNQNSCVDYRNKETMKRLLDQAQKVDPNTRTFDPRDCTEIISMPRQTNIEVLGTENPINVVENKWLNSKLLEDHVEAQFGNIEKLIEFYPESNNLEVIGKGIPVKTTGKLESLRSVTSSTVTASTEFTYFVPGYSTRTHSQMSDATSIAARSLRSKLLEENSEVALLINGMPYKPNIPEFSPNLERMFVCNPFENILRTVMRIENVGREAVRFSWMLSDFFAYNETLFEMLDDEFIFDTSPFQLRFGEIREVSVLFRPRKVSTVKQRWLLMTRPRIFFRRPCALTLNMHGRCTASPEYINLLMEYTLGYMKRLRRESLKESLEKFQGNVNEESIQRYCPYQRPLEEREAFNQRNKGFNCATFDDMEVLKNFYQRIKPHSRYPEWDYSVRLLINLVCLHKNKTKRIEFFEDLQNLLGRLRGRTKLLKLGDTEARILDREKTKFLYVRGLIVNVLEELEEKIWFLEKLFIKQRLQSRNVNQLKVLGEVSELQNELRHSKHLNESIYIYAYSTLCNLSEDIVSVIESTELV